MGGYYNSEFYKKFSIGLIGLIGLKKKGRGGLFQIKTTRAISNTRPQANERNFSQGAKNAIIFFIVINSFFGSCRRLEYASIPW